MKYLIKMILTFSMLASTINAFGQHVQWVELTMYPGTQQEMYSWLEDLQKEAKAANSQCYYLVAQSMSGEPRIWINYPQATFEGSNCFQPSRRLLAGAKNVIKETKVGRWGNNTAVSNAGIIGEAPEAVKTLYYKVNNATVFTETFTQIAEAMKATNPNMQWGIMNSISGQPLLHVQYVEIVDTMEDLDAMPQVAVPAMLAEHFGAEIAGQIWERHFSSIDELTFSHWRTMNQFAHWPE